MTTISVTKEAIHQESKADFKIFSTIDLRGSLAMHEALKVMSNAENFDDAADKMKSFKTHLKDKKIKSRIYVSIQEECIEVRKPDKILPTIWMTKFSVKKSIENSMSEADEIMVKIDGCQSKLQEVLKELRAFRDALPDGHPINDKIIDIKNYI